MDFFYFLVTSMEQYNDKYGFHSTYFAENSGFLEGFLYSLAIGIVIALVFYFGLCNGKSIKYATRVNWCIGLAIVALVAYFFGDIMVIGTAGNPGTGFYAFCQSFANDFMIQHQGNEQAIADCQIELNNILTQLNQGKDVALWFNISNAVYAMIAYFLVSIGVKNVTKMASQIPF